MLDSRLYRFGETAANLLILNALWLLASLPVVTFVPATAALFGVVRAWQRSGEPPLARAFVEQWRRNFAQSALLSGPWLLLGAGIAAAFVVIGPPDSAGSWLLFAPACIAATAFAFTSVYLFPVLVHYELRTAAVPRVAFLLSVAAAPTTLLCLLVVAAIVVLTAAVPILALWAGSVAAYGISWLCGRTFPDEGEIGQGTEKGNRR